MDILTEKNLRSLSDGLKLLRIENTKNSEQIIKINDNIVQLQQQLQLLQQQNAAVMSLAFGTGPTS